jgi:hypothetical protein
MPSNDLTTVFFITAVQSNRRVESRCWGWYRTKEEAWDDLKVNTGLFLESGSYNYVVIEELGSGIMACVDSPSDPVWIKASYDRTTGTYVLAIVPEPEFAYGVVGWSIG